MAIRGSCLCRAVSYEITGSLGVTGHCHCSIAGDRVLGGRFADTEAADNAWSRKTGVVALIPAGLAHEIRNPLVAIRT